MNILCSFCGDTHDLVALFTEDVAIHRAREVLDPQSEVVGEIALLNIFLTLFAIVVAATRNI